MLTNCYRLIIQIDRREKIRKRRIYSEGRGKGIGNAVEEGGEGGVYAGEMRTIVANIYIYEK